MKYKFIVILLNLCLLFCCKKVEKLIDRVNPPVKVVLNVDESQKNYDFNTIINYEIKVNKDLKLCKKILYESLKNHDPVHNLLVCVTDLDTNKILESNKDIYPLYNPEFYKNYILYKKGSSIKGCRTFLVLFSGSFP